MDKLDVCFMIFSMICFFVLGFFASEIDINLNDYIFEKNNVIPASEQEIIDNCKNLSLEESAYCLRDEISSFYNYTKTNDSLKLTLEDIKLRGGDCRNYAFLYERLTKGLSLNATTNNYKSIKDVCPGHRWAVIWDNETYCSLDMLKVRCKERG